jgi:hypothetical protein
LRESRRGRDDEELAVEMRPGGGGSHWLWESRQGRDEEELAAEIGAGRVGKDKAVNACDQDQDSCGIKVRIPTRTKA